MTVPPPGAGATDARGTAVPVTGAFPRGRPRATPAVLPSEGPVLPLLLEAGSRCPAVLFDPLDPTDPPDRVDPADAFALPDPAVPPDPTWEPLPPVPPPACDEAPPPPPCDEPPPPPPPLCDEPPPPPPPPPPRCNAATESAGNATRTATASKRFMADTSKGTEPLS